MLKQCTPVIITLLLLLALTKDTTAHEGREVGKYNLTVGFMEEPAYEGIPNGISVRVTKKDDAEHHGHQEQHDSTHEEHGHAATSDSKDDTEHHGHQEQHDSTREEHGHAATSDSVEAHGALFNSALPAGGTFEFIASDNYLGLTIPFHNHLDHKMVGSIKVSENAGLSEMVMIEIYPDRYRNGEVHVKPGTKIMWLNKTEKVSSITSGKAPEEHSDSTTIAVEGLETTLRVEITHVETNISRTMDLVPVHQEPGHYSAALIPTAQGVYKLRLFGTIESHEISETFMSKGGGGDFDDVQAHSVLQFPHTVKSVRELEAGIRGTENLASDASTSVTTAITIGIVGVILGIIGVAVGAASWFLAPRRS